MVGKFEAEYGPDPALILHVLSKRGNIQLQFLNRYSVSEGCESITWH
jgi:hypothetical protein